MRKTAFTTLMTLLPALAFAAEAPKDASAEDAAAWRSKRPDVPPAPTPVLPTFERRVLDNGLTLLVTQVDALPVVSFNLVTRGGATMDPEGKAGLTGLTYDMLEEGAGDLSALAFSDAVADLGASFGAGSGRQSGGVSISGLAKHADAMLGLLSDAARRPRLEQKDFERRKAQTVATLLRQRGSPQGLAFERIPKLIYGEGHPFGHPPTGTVETVKALTHADVTAHFPKVLGPAHSALVVAGALSVDEAERLAKKHFGDWTSDAAPRPEIPAVAAKPRTKTTIVDTPGAAQTMMIVGRPMFGKGHPDEYAVRLANLVYGGTFGARLNMNLREDKGYTYGAHSQASFRNGVGVFIAYSALRADATGKGLKETFDELGRLKSRPPTAEELEQARTGLVRSLPGKFEVTSDIAEAAGELFVNELPLDHFATLAARYEAVPLEAVQKKGVEYLDPSVMQVLLVGDGVLVRGQLAAEAEPLGLGEIVVEKP